MIEFENTEVVGWEAAIRGMRNPLNSWNKSDSGYVVGKPGYTVGPNDYKLMMKLRNAGTDHRKFMRMIVVYTDIIAPLYWWKEFDTYKVGTVMNSCSTMHKIQEEEFTLDSFSHEHLISEAEEVLKEIINVLNDARYVYNNFDTLKPEGKLDTDITNKKDVWWQMIQLLPSSYNQRRTIKLNYEVLANIYKSRKNHKLDEWSVGFMDWIKSLPYSELITGEDS